MEPDDWISDIGNLTVTTDTLASTYTIDTSDTIDLSSITLTSYDVGQIDWDENRSQLRDSGQIPIDIWAKLYNNGSIDD
jgi:hypothetical protein